MKTNFIIFIICMSLFHYTYSQQLSKKVFASGFNQTEISIAINPTDPSNLILSCNGEALPNPPLGGNSLMSDIPKKFHQPCFYSTDAGNTWSAVNGAYAPNGITSEGDPVVFFNLFGDAFYITMSNEGITLLKSTEKGTAWNSGINIDPLSEDADDKPHATADLSGIYPNNVYAAWTDFNSTTNGEVVFVKSTDRGETFGSRSPLFPCNNTVIMGVNLQIGPNGEIYAIAAKYSETDPINDRQEKKFVFTKSLNGGLSFSNPTDIFNLVGIRSKELSADFNFVRVNSWPSMAVDRSNGTRRGWIYIVYADKSTGDSEIYLRKSSDGGTTWSNKITVNSDPAGKQQWFPSIALDQVTGNIYISYYNMDGTNQYETSRWIAVSTDGGNSFTRSALSDTPFVIGSLSGYMGDYYETVAYNGAFYAAWSKYETSNFKYQAYINTPPNILVNQKSNITNAEVGQISIWENSQFKDYNVPKPFYGLSNLTIRGSQNIINGEKYNRWLRALEPLSDVTNHHSFGTEPGLNKFTSEFFPSAPSITIQNNLEGTGISAGELYFKDPWFMDLEDVQHGNNLMNRGMDNALWWQRYPTTANPFKPDYSTAYENGYTYKGVFLDQEISSTTPYYSIKADAEQIIPINGQNRKFYFLQWKGEPDKVQFQDSMAVQTGVVFKDENAVVSAMLKGNLVSGQTEAYTSNSQQKTIRDNNGYYHTVYSSMGMPWYIKSVTTNFNGDWTKEEVILPYDGVAKNPALDFYGNNLLVVYEYNQSGGTFLQLVMIDMTTGDINYDYDGTPIPSSFFGNAKPVIAYTNGEIYVAYKESTSSTLKFWRKYQDGIGQWQTTSGNIPNTTSNSLNITIASKDSPNDIYIAWQERTTTGTANSIKYMYSSLSGTARSYSSFTTISGSSGFVHNINPSISYYSAGGSRYPIISWTGRDEEIMSSRTIARTKSALIWGSYFISGSGVTSTVNQSVTNSDNTVIAWSENNANYPKYAKRINAQYSCVGTALSHYGTDVSLSGGNSLSQIKALIFKGTGSLPFLINKSTTDFSATCIIEQGALSKITENDTIVTFGRSGIVSINDIEFIFEIGDILVGDSIIKFIEIPDTLAYNSAIELNEHTRTNSFTLTQATNFYFSNIYHVVQKSNPDTALTTLDAVNFKAELVNSSTNQVIGTFDNVTYNKNNLEKYANIDYEVDCSGITPGEYYLRLVTNVNGNANYTLANIFNDNTTLAKKNFNKVNFTGSEIPVTYDLSQNYPNPFNPSTAIRYQIPQDGIVTLKIYDILGSEVATLVNEEKVAGKYEVKFNASSLASGVYIYKIQSGDFINSKKMILIK